MIKSVNTIQKLSLGQYDKNQSNTDIFRIGPIPVSPITARSEPTRRFDIRKEKSYPYRTVFCRIGPMKIFILY
jgi:hypothetical protein